MRALASRRDRRHRAPAARAGSRRARELGVGRRRARRPARRCFDGRRRRDPPGLADPAEPRRRASSSGSTCDGSRRVFEAAAAAGVGALVHASSVGVYSPGPKDRAVDESWPRDGVRRSFYSRHKARGRAAARRSSRGRPGLRVVRLRPGLIFKREAGPEIRRLFAGPFLPALAAATRAAPGAAAARPASSLQCVHGDDVGEAYRLAALSPRRARRLQHRRRPGARPARRWRALLGARPRTRARAAGARARRPRPGAPGCSPRRPAGSTWASPSR